MVIVMTTSCSDDDPIIENEEELITTVIYRMSPVGGGSDVEFQFSDPDGDGGEAPTISSEALAANTAYTGSLIFLDESNPIFKQFIMNCRVESLNHINREERAESDYHFSALFSTSVTPEGMPTTTRGRGTGKMVWSWTFLIK